MQVNRKILLSSENNELIKLSINFWDELSDKDEFLYKNHYYDVKSYKKTKNEVHVIAYKDKSEIILKSIKKTLHSKNKKSNPHLTKKYFNLYIFKISYFNSTYNFFIKKENFSNLKFIKNCYSFSIFHPPSFFNF